MRALIVDDSRFVRDYLRGLLEEKGIECDEAADGQAGLTRIHDSEEFDLALLDWNMPVMGGLQMVRELRRREPGLRIIATTGLEQDAKRLEYARLGVADMLLKPTDPVELLTTIQRCLQAPRAGGPPDASL